MPLFETRRRRRLLELLSLQWANAVRLQRKRVKRHSEALRACRRRRRRRAATNAAAAAKPRAPSPEPQPPPTRQCAEPASLTSASAYPEVYEQLLTKMAAAGQQQGHGRRGGGGGAAAPPPLVSRRCGGTMLQVTVADMRRLLDPSTWINDEAINTYCKLLQERSELMTSQMLLRRRAGTDGNAAADAATDDSGAPSTSSPSVYAFSSFLYSQLTRGGQRRCCDYAAVRRWTLPLRTRTAECVLSRDLLLVPINDANRHWCLVAIWPHRGRMEFYDSMRDAALGARVLSCLEQWFLADCADKGVALRYSRLQKVCIRGLLPRQSDGSSCGIFTCTFAELLARGAALPFAFSQRDTAQLRRGIAVDIMRQQVASPVLTLQQHKQRVAGAARCAPHCT